MATLFPKEAAWPRLQAVPNEEWTRRLAARWPGVGQQVLLHEGDLEVDSLRVGPQALVVTGHCRVRQLLEDGHQADHTLLVVLGDLQADRIATHSAIFVAGDATIRGTVFGDSLGDEVFCVGGTLSAQAVIEEHHHILALGGAKVGVLVGSKLSGPGAAAQTLLAHEALVKGAYLVTEKEGSLVTDSVVDAAGLLKLLQAGRPVLADVTLSPVEKALAGLREKVAQGETSLRLSLAAKKLKLIPDAVFGFPGLKSLVLDGNPIEALSPRMGELQMLQNLSLDSLPLKTLPAELCRLPMLKTLSLRYCGSLQLPDAFGDLAALEELHIDAMSCPVFPQVLARLPRLKKLWWWRFHRATPQQIESLVEGVRSLPKLTHVGFLQGELAALPQDLSALARLKQVRLRLDRIPESEVRRLEAALPAGRLDSA